MNAFSRDFRRRCAAINLAPAFRSWLIVAYALPEDREWQDLAPMERDLWVRRAEAALELFKHLAIQAPAVAVTDTPAAGAVSPGAAGGDPAHSQTDYFARFVDFTRQTAADRLKGL